MKGALHPSNAKTLYMDEKSTYGIHENLMRIVWDIIVLMTC